MYEKILAFLSKNKLILEYLGIVAALVGFGVGLSQFSHSLNQSEWENKITILEKLTPRFNLFHDNSEFSDGAFRINYSLENKSAFDIRVDPIHSRFIVCERPNAKIWNAEYQPGEANSAGLAENRKPLTPEPEFLIRTEGKAPIPLTSTVPVGLVTSNIEVDEHLIVEIEFVAYFDEAYLLEDYIKSNNLEQPDFMSLGAMYDAPARHSRNSVFGAFKRTKQGFEATSLAPCENAIREKIHRTPLRSINYATLKDLEKSDN